MTPTPKRRWFQFSTADLFLGVTLMAMGIGGLAGIAKFDSTLRDLGWILGIFYGSGALIGAGLFSPFRQKTVGAILGFLLIYPTTLLLERLF